MGIGASRPPEAAPLLHGMHFTMRVKQVGTLAVPSLYHAHRLSFRLLPVNVQAWAWQAVSAQTLLICCRGICVAVPCR